MRVGAIDIGTNSTRLLIAEVSHGRVKPIQRQAIITRLGEAVEATGQLQPQAMRRTLAVLDYYVKLADKNNVQRLTAIATSATRDAVNSDDFMSRVKQRVADARIISGLQEAKLTYEGVRSDPEITQHAPRLLVIDIGGGSTELIAGDSRHVETAVTMDVGAVRLTEMFLASDPATARQIEALQDHAEAVLSKNGSELKEGSRRAIAVAGTPTTLVAIDRRLAKYDSSLVHRQILSYEKVESLLGRLLPLNQAERRQVPGLEPARADVIVAGTAILLEIMAFLGLKEVLVSESDILDGLALTSV